MIEERTKKLRKALKYLLDKDAEKEIIANKIHLANQNIPINDLAKAIYERRGVDYSKIKSNNLIDSINDAVDMFKSKEKETRKKMISEIIYIIILLILIRIPFDLVRDIGYDYIEIISTKTIYYNLWNLGFLILYTFTLICTFLVLIRNFNNKYKNVK